MASREPGSSVSPMPWAVALLLSLGMERALALPESPMVLLLAIVARMLCVVQQHDYIVWCSSTLCTCSPLTLANHACQICTRCPGGVHNLSRVAAYCEDTSKLLQARCCLNQKGTILGLDLQNCSLKDPNLYPAYTAVIIDLQANPLKNDLTNTFRGFTQLQTLILPQDVHCPGGINAWDSVTSFMDKQICQGQKDLCNSTGSPEMCPENGSCASDGPGLLQCVCADGFHGYKCMRQGSFSLLMFFGILGSTTLAISILLWGTQRRKAKAS